jgi:hypothetical protein
VADFCRGCTAELFGREYADRNDLGGVAGEGEVILALCEGCGFHAFLPDGSRACGTPQPTDAEAGRPCPVCSPEVPGEAAPAR